MGSSALAHPTLVTALLDLGRGDIDQMGAQNFRSFDSYLAWLAGLLALPNPIVIYTQPSVLERINPILQARKPPVHIDLLTIDELGRQFEYFANVQEIRQRPAWRSRADWLGHSPQALLAHYNPLVMSKMRLLQRVARDNPFQTRCHFWCDAGLTRTVPFLAEQPQWSSVLERSMDRFLLASFPYSDSKEIHGFTRAGMEQLCQVSGVEFVARGGFFGGPAESIMEIYPRYCALLDEAFAAGDMGTEENILTALAYRHADLVARAPLAEDGLVWPLFAQLNQQLLRCVVSERIDLDVNEPRKAAHEQVRRSSTDGQDRPLATHGASADWVSSRAASDDQSVHKPLRLLSAGRAIMDTTIAYILTFNSHEQLRLLTASWADELSALGEVVVIDNSTDTEVLSLNRTFCEAAGYRYIAEGNLGVSGGRLRAGIDFEAGTFEILLYLEDDMLKMNKPGQCRSGFTRFVPRLLERSLASLAALNLDMLKLSYSEVYGTHARQWAWCNISERRRRILTPGMPGPFVPVTDEQLPETRYEMIKTVDELSVAVGEPHYSNWPQLMTRMGNKKLFLDPAWNGVFEQHLMAHAWELQLQGALRSGVLLASPIDHSRLYFYAAEERLETR